MLNVALASALTAHLIGSQPQQPAAAGAKSAATFSNVRMIQNYHRLSPQYANGITSHPACLCLQASTSALPRSFLSRRRPAAVRLTLTCRSSAGSRMRLIWRSFVMNICLSCLVDSVMRRSTFLDLVARVRLELTTSAL
jgi:hypothetical protein